MGRKRHKPEEIVVKRKHPRSATGAAGFGRVGAGINRVG